MGYGNNDCLFNHISCSAGKTIVMSGPEEIY
jgi:hypothetical protein